MKRRPIKASLVAGALSALVVGALTTPAHAAGPTPFGPDPVPLKDISPGNSDSIPAVYQSGAFVGSNLVFAAESSAGREPWITDGTPAGTKQLKDIFPGSGSSNPGTSVGPPYIVAFKGKVYFVADDNVHGQEIWYTDGTATGTKLLKDIQPGTAGIGPTSLTVAGSKLYFASVGNDSVGADAGRELWATDGTPGGTKLVKDINPGAAASSPLYLAAVGSKVAFTADAPVTGQEPYISDGTSAGTIRLGNDIFPGAADQTQASGFTAFGSKFLFSAINSMGNNELWISDGTALGTELLFDINDAFNSGGNPANFFALGSTAVFTATTWNGCSELWATDGKLNNGGTQMIRDFVPGPDSSFLYGFTMFKGKLYFFANETNGGGHDLWVTDGKPKGTKLVKDLPTTPFVDDPDTLMVAGDKLVFSSGSPGEGSEFWESDGTGAGTHMVADLAPGATGSVPILFAAKGSTVFFSATTSTGREPWAYTTKNSTTKGSPKTFTKKVADKKKIVVTVTVSASGATPTGKVTLRKGSTVIGTATLSGGKASIKVTTKLGKGSHSLKATYSGSLVARPSVSSSFTIKVK